MRRAVAVALPALVVAASVANPHFVRGGVFDVYGTGPWWQPAAAAADLLTLASGAVLLWRGALGSAARLFTAEALAFALLTGGAAASVGSGYFADGWGGSFFPVLWVAVALRLLLLGWTYRARAAFRVPAT